MAVKHTSKTLLNKHQAQVKPRFTMMRYNINFKKNKKNGLAKILVKKGQYIEIAQWAVISKRI